MGTHRSAPHPQSGHVLLLEAQALPGREAVREEAREDPAVIPQAADRIRGELALKSSPTSSNFRGVHQIESE